MRSIGCWSAQRISLVLLSCIATFVSSACSLTIDPDRQQCADDSECSVMFSGGQCIAGLCQNVNAGSGGGGGGGHVVPNTETNDWSCVGKPPPVTEGSGPFTVRMRATNILGSAPIVGATAKLCLGIDVDCTRPSDTKVSDAEGYFTFSVTKNFTGYVWVTPPDGLPEAEAVAPSLFFFNRQPQADITADSPPATPDTPPVTSLGVQMATPGIISALTNSLGSPQKDGNGITLNNVFDCKGKSAEGVVFKMAVAEGKEIPDETLIFYAKGSVPSATEKATTSSGYGGLVNAPPETVTIEAYINVDDKDYKVASGIFNVKANSISIKRLVPDGS